ncbi:hypothetical protein LOK49_LG08G00484 [Camellia lanceoleosa]|uniref:Uncharacterized protein n=1 Tax=Camellia lanceoleosa TaxID=1840588 RepID=A0ACC0GU95_9ERIC|nr:hypothetical protein LOK49_LG08G00484 [Camellia lanceoleosa]
MYWRRFEEVDDDNDGDCGGGEGNRSTVGGLRLEATEEPTRSIEALDVCSQQLVLGLCSSGSMRNLAVYLKFLRSKTLVFLDFVVFIIFFGRCWSPLYKYFSREA